MIKVSSELSSEDIVSHFLARHERLKNKVFTAESESDVRQAVLALYDLDLIGNLEKNKIDYVSEELWIEFKHQMDFGSTPMRCKIIAQILHYLHDAPHKHGQTTLPDGFAIVDKNYVLFYDTLAFSKYIIDKKYFDVRSPSASHPQLEKELAIDPAIQVPYMHILSDYNSVWGELEKRGIYAES